mmetsp:Transcript_30821/g.52147  ORF Transcript_30821/g.52147 Transcript_30821/m.52147 type:complete len:231 (-) Transcript_30821:766-1458(-)
MDNCSEDSPAPVSVTVSSSSPAGWISALGMRTEEAVAALLLPLLFTDGESGTVDSSLRCSLVLAVLSKQLRHVKNDIAESKHVLEKVPAVAVSAFISRSVSGSVRCSSHFPITVTVPPSGVNLSAFETKLRTTCAKCTSSPNISSILINWLTRASSMSGSSSLLLTVVDWNVNSDRNFSPRTAVLGSSCSDSVIFFCCACIANASTVVFINGHTGVRDVSKDSVPDVTLS